MPIDTINPATGKLIKSYPEMSLQEIDNIIDAVSKAFSKWRGFDFNQRAISMLKMSNLLKERKRDYAKLMASEMGKPLKQGEAEIEKCAFVCEHYAKHAHDYLQPNTIKTEMAKSYVTYQPLGVIFAIMPWNFPFWQVFRFAAPTIMAGNAALLKHAPISTGTALAIEQLFLEAGFEPNLFRTLIITDKEASAVIAHPNVMAVTLTGSTRAGKSVANLAGSAIKKTVLELGGSDPYLILEDANLEKAAIACVTSRMNNAGQSCIAAKRIITVGAIHDRFIDLVKEKLTHYQFGDPLDEKINCGPLARKDLRDTVHDQVKKSIELGAVLVMGGTIPKQDGFYYPPTLITHVTKGMPAYDEELFGPVVAVIHAQSENDAIHIANDTSYGLGAAIFTDDIERGEKIAVNHIQSGTCTVNGFVASDPRLPFGGIKGSGYGRELSAHGIHEFVNVKTIHIASA